MVNPLKASSFYIYHWPVLQKPYPLQAEHTSCVSFDSPQKSEITTEQNSVLITNTECLMRRTKQIFK